MSLVVNQAVLKRWKQVVRHITLSVVTTLNKFLLDFIISGLCGELGNVMNYAVNSSVYSVETENVPFNQQ